MNEKNNDILDEQKQNVDRLLKINYLTPDNCVFEKTPGGFASLEFEGKSHGRVVFYRTFPFTLPNGYISVREADDKAEEIGVIEQLDIFDESTVELISRQLELRYFTPQITRIFNIKEEYGYSYWTVQTDKGRVKFIVPNGTGNTVKITDTHIIIKDIDSNRYEIENTGLLTAKELKRLDLYI